ncbi:recombinase family protein [Sphingomonas cavernae]|uniref:Recombinase family protein n=1 Tax=Sphingomonas cavernae TaxID=2320861 RepID=A0A418W6H7_9SPHN|nr:recombinase family protein [Sphingomonas cavernae]RJF85537.1 recombinase family protein [Sphingomonas cavernae]
MVINWNQSNGDGERPSPGIPAAEYVRMSTEHQQYSTDNQTAAIRQYAQQHGYEIIKTYADEGKSGLNISGRPGLRQILEDVESGNAPFAAILVYDVSRFGRFQDADEAATYELRLRRAGVVVQYCIDQFDNDGSVQSSIIKNVKRVMAGAYSHDLSIKVFAGQAHLIRLGYRQGGAAGYGLRRMLIDQTGQPKGELSRGQHKSIATDRVVLIAGPDEEIAIVREVYDLFVNQGKMEPEIAAQLNGQGILTDLGRPWTRGTVHQLLINEKYIGNNVWGRTSFKLKQQHVRNDPAEWIRADNVFPGIVDRETFDKARATIDARSERLSDEELLEKLRTVLGSAHAISGLIIDEFEDAPSSSAYRYRFGSLLRAYSLVGFVPNRDYRYLEINRKLRELHPTVVTEVIGGLRSRGGIVDQNPGTDLLTINGEFTASIVIMRCILTSAGSSRWKLRLDTALKPDFTVGVRMNSANANVYDYYILPRLDMQNAILRLCEHNGLSLDAYRFDTLDTFYEFARRRELRRVG